MEEAAHSNSQGRPRQPYGGERDRSGPSCQFPTLGRIETVEEQCTRGQISQQLSLTRAGAEVVRLPRTTSVVSTERLIAKRSKLRFLIANRDHQGIIAPLIGDP